MKKYSKPIIEMQKFSCTDIITASSDGVEMTKSALSASGASYIQESLLSAWEKLTK